VEAVLQAEVEVAVEAGAGKRMAMQMRGTAPNLVNQVSRVV